MQGSFSQPDFAYGQARSPDGDVPVALSIYADRPHLRASLREDATAAGLTVSAAGPLIDLLLGAERPLGDVVMVDCPQVDGASLAALARLDMSARHGETRLIVSTSVDALEDVFACMDQSSPILLVDPDRAERVIALGQVLAGFPSGRLRELSDDDRLMLLRLTEQVGQIAGRIDRLDSRGSGSATAIDGQTAPAPAPALAPAAEGQLPDAKLVRHIIRQRQLRARFFDGDLFADPAWDMRSRLFVKAIYLNGLSWVLGPPIRPTHTLPIFAGNPNCGIESRMRLHRRHPNSRPTHDPNAHQP